MYQKAAKTTWRFVLCKGRGWLAFRNQDDIASVALCCLPSEFSPWYDVALAMQTGWGWLLFCILADSPRYSGVLPDLQWQGTSNQISGFTFVCNLRIIVFALYNFTCPPRRWLFRRSTWCHSVELSGLPSYRMDILGGQVGLHRTPNCSEVCLLCFHPVLSGLCCDIEADPS